MEFPLSPRCLTDLAVFARDKRDHENRSRYFRVSADHHRRRNLFGRRADKLSGLSRRPDPAALAVAHAVKHG